MINDLQRLWPIQDILTLYVTYTYYNTTHHYVNGILAVRNSHYTKSCPYIRLRGRVVLVCFTFKMKQDFVVNTVEQDDACYLFAFFDVVDSTNLQLSISLPRTKTNWSRFEMKFFDFDESHIVYNFIGSMYCCWPSTWTDTLSIKFLV